MAPVAPRSLPSSRLRLLIVDDDSDHIFLTSRELQKLLETDIATSNSGQAALAAIAAAEAAQESFDAVLLDNGLPDMPGLDVLLELREHDNKTPIVLVAGQGSEAIAVEALRRGANDYIVKSGDYLKMLPEVIRQVVRRARVQRRNELLEAEHVRFARLAALGEMAAGIAHEIRNPMSVIIGMATVIREQHHTLSGDEIETCARVIEDNCQHLRGVLEEVLQNAQASHRREPVFMADLIEETLSFLSFDGNFRRHMHADCSFSTRGLVHGDRDQLKQVLINIFRNAEQAVRLAHRSDGLLTITVEDDEASGRILTSIADNGNGIPPEVLAHIFESGFSTKKRGQEVEGSGLGLYLSRRIVGAHAGQLWAEPRDPASGALICLALPRHEDQESR